jgi:hypothetical protein
VGVRRVLGGEAVPERARKMLQLIVANLTECEVFVFGEGDVPHRIELPRLGEGRDAKAMVIKFFKKCTEIVFVEPPLAALLPNPINMPLALGPGGDPAAPGVGLGGVPVPGGPGMQAPQHAPAAPAAPFDPQLNPWAAAGPPGYPMYPMPPGMPAAQVQPAQFFANVNRPAVPPLPRHVPMPGFDMNLDHAVQRHMQPAEGGGMQGMQGGLPAYAASGMHFHLPPSS